jgi:hypothetical protein
VLPWAVLAAVGDPTANPVLTAALVAAAIVMMAATVRATPRLGHLLAAAAAMRLFALALSPTLSDDVWRYLWEGHVALEGYSPWHHTPEDPVLEPLRTPDWERVAHRTIPSIYPPLSLAGFSIAAATPEPLIAWKALLAGADLAVCGLIALLLRRRGLPLQRLAWYAWNPLPIVEGPGMGHLDALALATVLGGLVLLERPGRASAAGVALGLGALAKIAPVVLVPYWMKGSRRPWALAVTTVVVVTVGSAPMWWHGAPKALSTYAVQWEFNGPLYEPMWRAIQALDADTAIKAGFDQVERALERWELFDPWYRWVYPQFLAKLALLVLAGAGALVLLRAHDPLLATGTLFGLLLLCSATVYPWYLLWILPFAAISARKGWLLASVTIWLSYGAQLGLASLWPWLWALQWLPPLLVGARESRWSSTR